MPRLSPAVHTIADMNDEEGALTPGTGLVSAMPAMRALTPRYEPERHERYVAMLETAILDESPSAPRNIAVAGSYGTGKSSVLQGLTRSLEAKQARLHPVSLSLSSLGAERAMSRVSDSTPGDVPPVTNLIQKEIVKQLLYRLPPSRTPASRFRRLETPGRGSVFSWAVCVGVLAAAVVWALGAPSRVAANGWALGGFALLAAIVGGVARHELGGRVWLEKLTAGPASLTLGSAGSYFDQYLDEIVYYFDVSGCRVVIFEDIDRFDDQHIFETLRELNTLLNSSEKLAARGRGPIRFVYAIRDSIFDPDPDAVDRRTAAPPKGIAPATNRTKFFDLVVPMIPFITHRTARDVITDALGAETNVAPALVKLVSRHLVDMRLILNIVNEFHVFRDRILGPGGLDELTVDQLFALVVYKNVHLADFERISSGSSRLDDVYEKARAAANHAAGVLDEGIDAERRALAGGTITTTQAAHAAEKLQHAMVIVAATIGGYSLTGVQAGGTTFPEAEIGTPGFWRAVLAGDRTVRLTYNVGRTVVLGPSELEPVLGQGLEPDAWEADARTERKRVIDEMTADRRALVTGSLAVLLARDDLLLAPTDARPAPAPGPDHVQGAATPGMTVREFARNRLPSELAFELVEAGFIDQNFALYTADFYGVNLSAAALNFIMRVVQRDQPDAHYRFPDPARDVPAVLADSGDEFLGDPRAYNLDLFDHLLAGDPERLGPAFGSLGRGGPVDVAFVDTYLREGKHAERLVRGLAGHWSGIFTHVVAIEFPADRSRMLDAALHGATDTMAYVTSQQVAEVLDADAGAPTALTGTWRPDAVDRVVAVAERLGAVFTDISVLSDEVRDGVLERGLYAVNERNLRCAVPHAEGIALDDLLSDPRVHARALAYLDDYLRILDADPGLRSVADPARLVEVLDGLAGTDDGRVETLLARAVPGATVGRLTDAPPELWSVLARARRVSVTSANLRTYLSAHDGLSPDWDDALASTSVIEVDADTAPPERDAAVLAVLGSAGVPAEHRVRLTSAFDPLPQLAESALPAAALPLIPELVRAKVVADELAAFTRCPDTATKARLIGVSGTFPTYLAQLPADGPLVEAVVASGRDEALTALVRLPAAMQIASAADAAQLARWVVGGDVRLDHAALVALTSRVEDPDVAVSLVTRRFAELSRADAESILAVMPDPYRGLVSGERPATITVPARHRDLVKAMTSLGIVAGSRKAKGRDALVVRLS